MKPAVFYPLLPKGDLSWPPITCDWLWCLDAWPCFLFLFQDKSTAICLSLYFDCFAKRTLRLYVLATIILCISLIHHSFLYEGWNVNTLPLGSSTNTFYLTWSPLDYSQAPYLSCYRVHCAPLHRFFSEFGNVTFCKIRSIEPFLLSSCALTRF